MTVARSQPYVPLEDFLEMEPEPGTWREWCAGIVYSMGGGGPEHSRLGARLGSLLMLRLGADVFGSNADIWVDAAQFYGQADASVVCGALRTYTVKRRNKILGEAITNPEIIVEVLSPSTATRDLGVKFEAYKQLTSLREYVLVSQDERRIEIRRRDKRGWSIETAGPGETIVLHGIELAVDEIYG
ncbi:MAG: Uma2 family endonuclease [Labilithrix sp.]|nr:Uma2 family endonuclease [Labilithrix sp.]MCW5810744.1 Uma2 family endonuclease [Labilithrix sp.]